MIVHDGAMFEYLIRTVSTQELPAFPDGRLAEVLVPAGFGCEQADGRGDFPNALCHPGLPRRDDTGELSCWRSTVSMCRG